MNQWSTVAHHRVVLWLVAGDVTGAVTRAMTGEMCVLYLGTSVGQGKKGEQGGTRRSVSLRSTRLDSLATACGVAG